MFGSQVLGPSGIDETFAGQLVFPGGVLAQIDAGFRSPFRAELEIAGTTGTIRVRHPWKPAPDQPILLTRGEETESVAVAECDRYLLEIEDLAEAVRDRPPAARQPRREPRQRGHDRGAARVRPHGTPGEAVALADRRGWAECALRPPDFSHGRRLSSGLPGNVTERPGPSRLRANAGGVARVTQPRTLAFGIRVSRSPSCWRFSAPIVKQSRTGEASAY